MNEDIWCVIDTTSKVLSGTDNVNKFDTIIQRSKTQERNLELLRIEDGSLKIIFPELGTEIDRSVRVNLANSVVRKSPNFKSLGHPTIEIADIQNLDCISATIPKNCNGLQRGTDRDDRLGCTHDFETMSETTAYRNHIKNSEIETREVFEQETSSPQNIQQTVSMNIVTQLDNNQLTRSTDIQNMKKRTNRK